MNPREVQKDLKRLLAFVSPLTITAQNKSLTLSISQQFFLFQLFEKLEHVMSKNPRLAFLSALKHYKRLGSFLHGTVEELFHEKDKSYFRRFFSDPQLAAMIAEELAWAYRYNKYAHVTLMKNGLLIYDNYQPKTMNMLLFTIHSGEWLPSAIQKKQVLSPKQLHAIEDTATHYLFGPLVLQGAGIWINTKLSRFACDLNRPKERAIYENHSESWIGQVWKQPLTMLQRKTLLAYHQHFYLILQQLIKAYHFALLVDAHSMRALPGRPAISFGIAYLHPFYLPLIRAMKQKLHKKNYSPVAFNNPYKGGYLPQWLHQHFPDRFLVSMEINKALYMNKDNVTLQKKKFHSLSADLQEVFSF